VVALVVVTAIRPLVHRVPAKKQRPDRAAKRKQTPKGNSNNIFFFRMDRIFFFTFFGLAEMAMIFPCRVLNQVR
jgi:hypothetical protein